MARCSLLASFSLLAVACGSSETRCKTDADCVAPVGAVVPVFCAGDTCGF